MVITPIPTPRVEYPTHQSLSEWVIDSLPGDSFQEGDILVISSKIVSFFEGNIRELSGIQVGEEAKAIASRMDSDPQLLQLVMDEADEVIAERPWVLLTLKNGIYCANAGVDTSNVPAGHAVIWPSNPYQSVHELHLFLKNHYKLNTCGVVMIDSVCVPGRKGTIAVSLAASGIETVHRLENTEDLFGNVLRYSSLNCADSVATAANFVMGESTESCPLSIVKDAPVKYSGVNKNDEILISSSEDLFQLS